MSRRPHKDGVPIRWLIPIADSAVTGVAREWRGEDDCLILEHVDDTKATETLYRQLRDGGVPAHVSIQFEAPKEKP